MEPTEKRQPSAIRWGLILTLGLCLVVILTLVVIIVLGPSDLNKDKSLRLNALKLILAGVAGYGAAVTVWLALRRQQHHEINSWDQHALNLRKQNTEDVNSRARRALDLYSAAAEQLGSDQPAVRLAGIYTFERLASEEAEYRQTVVDVFCAYLRMDRAHEHEAEQLAEQQVRTSMQTVLLRHMRKPQSPLSWGADIRVNLSGATLRDFDASGSYFSFVRFTDAKFHGHTLFDRATFASKARFDHCRFNGRSSFRVAVFDGGADFGNAEFEGLEAGFTGARFLGGATRFSHTKLLASQIIFRGVKFHSEMSTNFSRVQFGPTTSFKRSRFNSRVTSFNRAEFSEPGEPFMKVVFHGPLIVDDLARWAPILKGAHVLGSIDSVHSATGNGSEDDQDEQEPVDGEPE